MFSTFTRAAVLAGLAVWSHSAIAQTVQPGLWEMTRKIQGAMGALSSPENQAAIIAEMQQQMAKMPPAQRHAMEENMRKNSIINMNISANANTAKGGGTAMKICLTQEMIDRKDWMDQTEGQCTRTASPAVGNTQKFSFVCANPASSGEGSVTFQSKTSYTSASKLSMVRNGKPESMSFTSSANFLSADCGAVKPLTLK